MGLFFEESSGNETGCTLCPLHTDKTKIIPAHGNKGAEVLILKSGVNRREVLSNQLFSGYEEEPLQSLKDEFSLYYDTVVRCIIPEKEEKKNLPKILTSCKAHWEFSLDHPKIKVVIAYGEAAFKSLTGLSNIGSWRRTFVPIKTGGRVLKVYPLLCPDDFDERRKKVVRDILKIDLNFFKKNARKEWEKETIFLSDVVSDHVPTIKRLTTFPEIEDGLNRFLSYPEKYFDYETTSLFPTLSKEEKILTVSLSYKDDTIAFPVQHPGGPEGILDLWKEFVLKTPSQRSVAHNLIFELMWTRFLFSDLKTQHRLYHEYKWGDTKAKAYAASIPPGRLSLGDMTKAYFGTDLKSICNVDPVKWFKYPLKTLLLYNGMDSLWTNKLDQAPILPRWGKDEYAHHLHIIPSLVEMYFAGIEADQKPWGEIREQLKETESVLLAEIQEHVRESGYYREMLPSSPTSLLAWFNFLELGVENTKEETLQEIVEEHPSIESILEYRAVSKLRTTYAEGLTAVLHADGKFHPSYSSTAVKSGRLNCKNPNLQQIPKRKAAYVRKLFVPGEGNIFAALDMAQLEVRVLACASRDPNLIDYIQNDKDIHREWAEYIVRRDPKALDRYARKFGMDRDHPDLMGKIRGDTKSGFVFLSFYGGSAKKCARMMGADLDLAQEAQTLLFQKYPLVREYQRESWESYRKTGYVESLTGRRISGVLSWNQVINLPIQSTGSDLVTHAGARLCKLSFETNNPNILVRINIHDDNTSVMEKDGFEENVLIVAKEMVRPEPWFVVNFSVEVSIGENWYEMKKYFPDGKKVLSTSDFFPDFLK